MSLPLRRAPMPRLLRSRRLAPALSVPSFAGAAPAEPLKDQAVIAAYLHKTRFRTMVGDITFGESSDPRALFVQYRGIASNHLEQLKRPGTQVILYPPADKSGDFVYPDDAQR
jgi:hypothetical protein